MSVLYFLLTIVLLVVIHEWGHFATARFFGVGVRSFTVGFGKQIYSWVDPKTGTSWGIAPFPVGGYVGLLGEKDSTEASNTGSVMGKPFMDVPLYAKLLILAAGPFVNIVFAALLYSVLAYSSPNPALPVLATPMQGSQAAQAGLQSGDVLSSVNGVSVESWRAVQTELLHLSAGESFAIGTVGSNAVKALVMPDPIARQSNDELLGLRLYSKGLRVQMLLPDGAAIKAGLRVNDVMLQVNGKLIDHPDVLLGALQMFKAGDHPLEISVERMGQLASAFVVPELDSNNVFRIGIQFAGLPQLSTYSLGIVGAAQDGLSTAFTASLLTVKAFGAFLLKPFNSDQLAGPITIAKAAKASADRGWMAAMAFVAGLSISVGILNLLPVPVLDGGQIVFHSVRSAAKTLGLSFKMKTNEQLNRWWVSSGVTFVVLLTMLAFLTDFKRWFGF
jgi:regulator of sigma E protease